MTRLKFKTFSNTDAFLLGKYISEKSIKENLSIVIRIERNNQIIFQFAANNTSKDNEFWIEKKANVVKRFGKSSRDVSNRLLEQNLSFEEKYGASDNYAVTPGSVPIEVIGVGVVAVVTISGLDSESDHKLILEGLNYLKTLKEEKEKWRLE